MNATPGQVITPDDGLWLTGAAQGLLGTLTLGIWTLGDQDIVSEAVTTDIEETERDDGKSNYGGTRTAPDETGAYQFFWDDGSGEDPVTDDLVVRGFVLPEDAFATAAQVAARSGRTFTDAETAQATMLCALVTALIAEAAGKDETWVADLDPVPAALNLLCIEVTARAMANPTGATATREQLAAYSYSQNFSQAGVLLTDDESRLVRRVVFGRGAASARMRGIFWKAEELLREGERDFDLR